MSLCQRLGSTFLGDLLQLNKNNERDRFKKLVVFRHNEAREVRKAVARIAEVGGTIVVYGDAGVGKTIFITQFREDPGFLSIADFVEKTIVLTDLTKPNPGDPWVPAINFDGLEVFLRQEILDYLIEVGQVPVGELELFRSSSPAEQHRYIVRKIRDKIPSVKQMFLVVDDVDHFSNDAQAQVFAMLIPFMSSPNIVTMITARPPVARRLRQSLDMRITANIAEFVKIDYLGAAAVVVRRFEEQGKVELPLELVDVLDGVAGTDTRTLLRAAESLRRAYVKVCSPKYRTIAFSQLTSDDLVQQLCDDDQLYNVFKETGRNGEPLLLYVLQYLNVGNSADTTLYNLLNRLGCQRERTEKLITQLVNWGMVTRFFFRGDGGPDNREYILTNRGKYYGWALARNEIYCRHFGGTYKSMLHWSGRDEMLENAAIEFLFNDLPRDCEDSVGALYQAYLQSSHSGVEPETPLERFAAVLRRLELVAALEHSYSREARVRVLWKRLEALAPARGIVYLPTHRR